LRIGIFHLPSGGGFCEDFAMCASPVLSSRRGVLRTPLAGYTGPGARAMSKGLRSLNRHKSLRFSNRHGIPDAVAFLNRHAIFLNRPHLK
jgi:hypothetical protein